MIELTTIGFLIITAPIWVPMWIVGKIFQELRYFYYENLND